jgi:hypothetical protein
MYQSVLVNARVFLVVNDKLVLIVSRYEEEDAQLPMSVIGVWVIGSKRMPDYTIDQQNLVAVG